jgi:threonylcarbamoyladenosine tRNA methylthiotransferase CDKAL1
LPEASTIWIKTFGCSHNVSDGEYMAGQLQEYGFRQAFVCEGETPVWLGWGPISIWSMLE